MKFAEFVKRDIIEMLLEDGLELTLFDGGDVPYYHAFCPLHDNTKTEAFIVYPHVQSWTCYGCHPGWHDIIDYFQLKNRWSFGQAKEFCTNPLSNHESVTRHLQEQTVGGKLDMLHITSRMHNLVEMLGVQEARLIFQKVDRLFAANQWIDAERELRRYGV